LFQVFPFRLVKHPDDDDDEVGLGITTTETGTRKPEA
jgi:hypothetical protein